MLIVDWLIWRLLLERKNLDSGKNTLRDKLTTPSVAYTLYSLQVLHVSSCTCSTATLHEFGALHSKFQNHSC